MTYDEVDVLSSFSKKEMLSYALLQDQNAGLVNALGIRNEDFEAGHRAYGIPHPGVIWVDKDGKVAAKFALQGFRARPPFEALYEHIKEQIEQG